MPNFFMKLLPFLPLIAEIAALLLFLSLEILPAMLAG